MALAPTYTEAQVFRYLERIKYPLSGHLISPPPTLITLRRLVACHLDAIPFENFSLHYSTHHSVTIDENILFDKLINQGKGGYCMEQNRAFSTLLRTLGYDLYTIGARVSTGDQFTPFAHMAIILTLDGIEYLVDVGFGGNGLTAPLPIYNGTIISSPIKGVLPEEHRIYMMSIPYAAKRDHKIWALQHRRDPEAEWVNVYIFEKDFEFFEGDYQVYVHYMLY
jgi:arylamine N-acetyltransferase